MTAGPGYEVRSAESSAVPDVVDADRLIDPSIFPLRHDRMNFAALEAAAASLRTMATAAVDRTDAIAAVWTGLQGCYSSPEAPAVYALMVPAQTAAGQVAERLRAAAGALERYAEALGGGFKTRLETKVEECEAFRTEALAGVWIQVTDTDKASFFDNVKEVVSVGHYDKKVHVSWDQDGGDGGMVDRNEQLREDYAALVTEAFNLAAACADEIAATAGLSVQMAQMLGVGVVEQITSEDLLAAWGPAAQEDRNCVEQTGQGFADFGTGIWDGGRMLVGYDPTTGDWSWGTFGQAWGGVVNLVGSIAVMAVSLPYALTLPVREALGQDTYTGFDNWMYERAEMTASLVGYDPNAPDGEGWHNWKDEPWRVGTTTVVNIATIAIPGGAVGSGVKGASTAAKLTRAASIGARGVAEVLAPGGSWAVRGAGMLGRSTTALARGQGWAGALDAMRVASGSVRPSVAGIGAGTAGAASDLGRMAPPTTMHPDVPSVSGSVRPPEVPRVRVPEAGEMSGAGPSRADAGAGAGRGADGASVLDDAAARESWLYQEAPVEPSAAARAEGAQVSEPVPAAQRELVSVGAERAGQGGTSAVGAEQAPRALTGDPGSGPAPGTPGRGPVGDAPVGGRGPGTSDAPAGRSGLSDSAPGSRDGSGGPGGTAHGDGPGGSEPSRSGADGGRPDPGRSEPAPSPGEVADGTGTGSRPVDGQDPAGAGPARSISPTPEVLAEHPRPATDSTVTVAADQLPGPRTPFVRADASGGMVLHDGRPLEPGTVYEVDGRGRFYTDADGQVVRIETTSGGGAGVNPDLNRPLPGVEYVVNGDTVFRTDDLARTAEMDARGLTASEGTRSDSIQGSVGAEGRAEFTDPVTGKPLIDPTTGKPYDYEGGHLRGAQFDGPRERINYVPMLEQINNARSHFIDPVSNRNFGTLENELAAIVKDHPGTVVDFNVRPVFEGTSKVPVRIEVRYRVDGGRWIRERFVNV